MVLLPLLRPSILHLVISSSRSLHSALISRPFCYLLMFGRCQPYAEAVFPLIFLRLASAPPTGLPGLPAHSPAPKVTAGVWVYGLTGPGHFSAGSPLLGISELGQLLGVGRAGPAPRILPLSVEASVPPQENGGLNSHVIAQRDELMSVKSFLRCRSAEHAALRGLSPTPRPTPPRRRVLPLVMWKTGGEEGPQTSGSLLRGPGLKAAA